MALMARFPCNRFDLFYLESTYECVDTHTLMLGLCIFQLLQDRVDAISSNNNTNSEHLQRLKPRVSWETYSSWNLQGNDLYIGRKPVLKVQSKDMKFTVSMVMPN